VIWDRTTLFIKDNSWHVKTFLGSTTVWTVAVCESSQGLEISRAPGCQARWR